MLQMHVALAKATDSVVNNTRVYRDEKNRTHEIIMLLALNRIWRHVKASFGFLREKLGLDACLASNFPSIIPKGVLPLGSLDRPLSDVCCPCGLYLSI